MPESSSIFNHAGTGAILGIFAPPVAFGIFSLLNYPDASFQGVLNMYSKGGVLTHVISLSVIVNLLIFFLFIWSSKERSAQGVLGATIAWALLVLILKLT